MEYILLIFPKLVSAAEHFKDHIKAEILTTKKRIIEIGGQIIEETYTDPLKSEMEMQSDNINNMYTTKGI
jgi:hypothetical protein